MPSRHDVIHVDAGRHVGFARHTEARWGKEQRNRYVSQLDKAFRALAVTPSMGIACDVVGSGYRKFSHGSHVIFCREGFVSIIEVVRILHERMDVDIQALDS